MFTSLLVWTEDRAYEWHHWALDDPVATQLNILWQLYDLQGRVHLSSAVAHKTFQQFIFDITIHRAVIPASAMTTNERRVELVLLPFCS